MRTSTAVAVVASLSLSAGSGLIARAEAPIDHAAQVQPQAQPASAARTIELALEALREGRTEDAEGLLARAVATLRSERIAAARAASGASGQPVRVGGGILEPKKLRDVRPHYPLIAQAAQVTGIVILETTIGRDGSVKDARVLRSIALLDQAALDAVYQWQYTPTLLNGVPVEVIMTVTVNFSLGR